MSEVNIGKDGTVIVDGKVITPAEVENALPYVDKAWREVSNKANWNVKQVEKGAVWLAGIAAATNGFGQIAMPNNVRGLITLAAGLVLAAIHVSSPKAT